MSSMTNFIEKSAYPDEIKKVLHPVHDSFGL